MRFIYRLSGLGFRVRDLGLNGRPGAVSARGFVSSRKP